MFLPILLFPIEVFSHLARIMSLTVRLFANMFAGEMVTLVFFSLIPLGLPVVFEGLHIGVSFIQTYIFVLLAACIWARRRRTNTNEDLRSQVSGPRKVAAKSARRFLRPETWY
jgi:F0F1-type ATP synthase membrane subunit a